jgi:hypothetical protein
MRHFMKHFVLIITLISFSACVSNNSAAESKCTQFKTGDFVQYDHEISTTYQINRSDSLQTEYNSSTRTMQISKIVWKNECEYDLYKIVSDGLHPKADSARGTKPLHIIMTDVKDDYYIFKAKVAGIDFIYSDTIFKIK